MKKLTFLALMVTFCSISLISCNKDSQDGAILKNQNITDNEAMSQHILDFKEKCEYYLANPGLKSGGSIPVDSAVREIEAVMNFTYGFHVKISNLRLDTSNITLPVNYDGTMEMDDIAAIFEEVTDSVKAHYTEAPFQTKKLIAIVLNYCLNNNEYELNIISATGNTSNTTAYPSKDYFEGRFLGSCDQTISGTDAAEEIQKTITNIFWEEPQQNCHYYWPNPVLVSHYPTPSNINNYRNPGDPEGDPPNNHLDYIIFYMIDNITNYEDPHCMLRTDEIPFYEDEYNDMVTNALSLNSNFKFQQCDFNGWKFRWVGNFIQGYYLAHTLDIFVGIRAVSCDNNYPINID